MGWRAVAPSKMVVIKKSLPWYSQLATVGVAVKETVIAMAAASVTMISGGIKDGSGGNKIKGKG